MHVHKYSHILYDLHDIIRENIKQNKSKAWILVRLN